MRSISFIIPGIPTAWARARTHGKIHFTPGKQRYAMSVIQTIAHEAMAGQNAISVPVSMTIFAVWPWPKSWSEKKRRKQGAHYKTSKPDADNVGKLVSDSLNGIVFNDDAQIVDMRVIKQYGLNAQTRVVIDTLQEEEN
jgi:Holliday junction resolvase RusA-like endonuclease